ncbi:class GN sortase [Elongatibacter sediminis]|uniref:Class GN sortase n=1 Tax=Elongatibacter sediminis TaxID=3119006 RepID=A0AAW9RJP3_9GAMM
MARPDRSRIRPPRALTAVPRTAVFFLVAGSAAALALHAVWIPVKAELAQVLLSRSWQAVRDGNADSPPWPWADTLPAGVLRVPRLGLEQFVLAGQSGRNLAFGPVFANGPGAGLDRVLSGHRDTHFRFLEQLRPGDRLELETGHGTEIYEMTHAEVIDSRRAELVIEPGRRRLSLVTCYPFGAATTGGPLRYVVTALPSRGGAPGKTPSKDQASPDNRRFSTRPRSVSSP